MKDQNEKPLEDLVFEAINLLGQGGAMRINDASSGYSSHTFSGDVGKSIASEIMALRYSVETILDALHDCEGALGALGIPSDAEPRATAIAMLAARTDGGGDD